jgi:hypothetical protein
MLPTAQQQQIKIYMSDQRSPDVLDITLMMHAHMLDSNMKKVKNVHKRSKSQVILSTKNHNDYLPL